MLKKSGRFIGEIDKSFWERLKRKNLLTESRGTVFAPHDAIRLCAVRGDGERNRRETR
jgi:hypothetical protein